MFNNLPQLHVFNAILTTIRNDILYYDLYKTILNPIQTVVKSGNLHI